MVFYRTLVMIFNGLELTAILKMAKAMAVADGKLESVETAVMTKELVRFGVTPDDLKLMLSAVDDIEASQATIVIAAMDQEQKKYVASYLGLIMASDGNIDENELALWRLVSTVCGLPTMSIGEAIRNMKNL